MLFFIKIDAQVNIVATINEIILYVNLLFLLIIGLLYVSAGAFLIINNIPIIPKISLIFIGITVFIHNIGTKMKINDDDTKHIQLLVACNPNDGILIILYSAKKIST